MQYYFCLIRNETNLKYKTGDNKMKQDKNTFVESRKSEIEMEKAFIKSCDVLKKKEEAIENIDKAIASYQELGRIIKSTLEGMPECLRGYISIDAPINY